MTRKPDFGGWVTKYNVLCGDGRTIKDGAFEHCDGKKVPLVWNHQHNSIDNVLGHVILHNVPNKGVYGDGFFNETESGESGKISLKNGDIDSMSIWADGLKQTYTDRGNPNLRDVCHGTIKEVSLVLAGRNPGAMIDFVNLEHSADTDEDFEAIIYNDSLDFELEHSYEKGDDTSDMSNDYISHADEKTVNEAIDSLTEKQKTAFYVMLGMMKDGKNPDTIAKTVISEDGATVDSVWKTFDKDQKIACITVMAIAANKNKANNKGESKEMKQSAFDNNDEYMAHASMTGEEARAIIADAKNRRASSLRDEFLAHSVTDDDGNEVTYGIANIDYLFPDARTVNPEPDFIKRDTEWVSTVMNGVHHTPFSRIKSIHADITMEEARARGYIKGNEKAEEVFLLLKRTTDPQTVYKKQKLDRDDITDIVDLDVARYIKSEMRVMLDEEIARAILVGDGRSALSPDKIKTDNIRPIWTDSDTYTINQVVSVASDATADQKAKAFIRAAIKARKDYKGSGNPILFTTEDMLTDCLLLEDQIGRVLYESEERLRVALRVSKIVTVPVMENLTRIVGGATRYLLGIIINPKDYNVGADKGGAISLFEDFDIDFNQEKYLIETRISGANIKPKSAIALELSFQ